MHSVLMLCAAGTSTHVFASKVQEALDARGEDIRVSASTVSEVKDLGADADLLLLGPQVSFELELVKSLFPDKRVESVALDAYASMDSDAVIAQIKRALEA